MNNVAQKDSLKLWQTVKLRLFTLFKIPMIFYVRPVVRHIDDSSSHVVVPYSYRTKNHVSSMYFGALSVGADLCIGLLGFHHINKSGQKLSLVFKDFKISFLKKAHTDVHFICREGDKVHQLVEDVLKTNQRQNITLQGIALARPQKTEQPGPCTNHNDREKLIDTGDTIAEFTLTLSIK